jgi:hypothetical protein
VVRLRLDILVDHHHHLLLLPVDTQGLKPKQALEAQAQKRKRLLLKEMIIWKTAMHQRKIHPPIRTVPTPKHQQPLQPNLEKNKGRTIVLCLSST